MGGDAVSRMRVFIALTAWVAIEGNGILHAQVRGAVPRQGHSNERESIARAPMVDESLRTSRVANAELWLQRLVGVYTVQGTHKRGTGSRVVRSTALCSSIGNGSGVRCIIGNPSVGPDVPSALANKSFDSIMLPMMFLGVNSLVGEIQLVWLGDPMQGRSGVLEVNGISFSIDNWQGCREVFMTCLSDVRLAETTEGGFVMNLKTTRALSAGGSYVREESTYELVLHRDTSRPGPATQWLPYKNLR